MDKNPDNSYGIQYIICECGDNFPNEKLLNFHLAHDHADVDTFQCEYCAEILPSAQLYKHHINQHNVQKPDNKPSQNPKPYSKINTSPENVVKNKPKPPPVIRLQNLKKIDDISLIKGPVSEQLEVAPEIAAEEIAQTDTIPSEEDKERYYKCHVCHKIFASEDFFQCHYNKVHAKLLRVKDDTEKNQKAPPEDQSQEETLESTESQNHSIKEHQGREPLVEAKLEIIKPKETKVSQTPEQVTYFKCDLCKILYPSEKAYKNHYNKKHSGPMVGFQFIEQDLEGPYLPPPKQDEIPCELCNRTFVNKRSHSIHYRRVHCPQRAKPGGRADASQPSRVYECELCGKKCICNRKFVSKRSYSIHYRRVHCPQRVKPGGAVASRPSRNHECEICGKKCISNFNLVNHQRTHTGEKPYLCSECPKRFSVHQLLQIHLRTHTGERPFQCSYCPKAFVNRAALNRHDRVHTGVKPYSCQHCGKSFSQSNSMKLHVNTVHLKMPAPYKHRRNKNE